MLPLQSEQGQVLLSSIPAEAGHDGGTQRAGFTDEARHTRASPARVQRLDRVTRSLSDLGESTELIFTQRAFATEGRRALHEQGWTDGLDRLQELMGQVH
jgi:activator of Hsp90 ATPase-like protein